MMSDAVDYMVKTIVALSGTTMAIIFAHRILFVTGVLPFEFRRPERVWRLFHYSFIVHMVSLVSFLIMTVIK